MKKQTTYQSKITASTTPAGTSTPTGGETNYDKVSQA